MKSTRLERSRPCRQGLRQCMRAAYQSHGSASAAAAAAFISRRAMTAQAFSNGNSNTLTNSFVPLTQLPETHPLFTEAHAPPRVVLLDACSSRRITTDLLTSVVVPHLAKRPFATTATTTRSASRRHVVRALAFSTTTPLLQDASWADGWEQHLTRTAAQGIVAPPGMVPSPSVASSGHNHEEAILMPRLQAAFGASSSSAPLVGTRPIMPYLLSSSRGPMAPSQETTGAFVTVEFFRIDGFIPVHLQIQTAVQHMRRKLRTNPTQASLSLPTSSTPQHIWGIVAPDHRVEDYEAFLTSLSRSVGTEASPSRGGGAVRIECLLFNSRGSVREFNL